MKSMHKYDDERNTEYVIIYGGLSDGFQGVVGPFNSEDEAEIYMEAHNLGHFEKFVCILEGIHD